MSIGQSNHGDAMERCSIQPPAIPQDVENVVSLARHLALPTKAFLLEQLPSGPREIWSPQYIHTAKCDRCGEHNTSVIQRSSRTNRQFCKVCMYLNSSDGTYSVNVEELDWNPQTGSVKRGARGTTKRSRKLKRPKNGLVIAQPPTKVSKWKRSESQLPRNKRIRLPEQPESENRSENSTSLVMEGSHGEGDETEDDVGFGRLPPSTHFSSEGQEIASAKPELAANITECLRSTFGKEEGLADRSENETENTLELSVNKLKLPPWLELTQTPESNAQTERQQNPGGSNVHTNLEDTRRSDLSPEVIAAVEILLTLAKESGAFPITGINQG